MTLREITINIPRRYTPHQFTIARALPDHLVSIYHRDFHEELDIPGEFFLEDHHPATQENADDLCGVVEITTHGDDTHDACLHTTHAHWKFQTNKRVSFQARTRLAKVGGASFLVGLGSHGAGEILDEDGAGPNDVTYDGAFLFVTETAGTMASVWSFLTSNGASKSTTTTLGTYTDNTWDVVGFDYDPHDGVTGILTPYVGHDGGNFVYGATHSITISGLDAMMRAHMSVRNGTSNAETLGMDFFTVWQER